MGGMDMRKPAMGWLAAMFCSSVAGLPLTVFSNVAVQADDCLVAPNDQPMQGSHWRFRIDRATNRQCWYLRSDDSQVAPPPALSTGPATPPKTAWPRSAVNAHAEIVPAAKVVQQNSVAGSTTENIVD